jgi:hypothetical protein
MESSKVSNKDLGEAIFGVIIFLVIVIGVPISIYFDHKTEEKYGPEKYEIVILDKWEDIGSTYHLVGGRAPETEYHVQYKYRCTNRPDDEFKSNWQERDTEVKYPRYKKYKVGTRYVSDSYFINTR